MNTQNKRDVENEPPSLSELWQKGRSWILSIIAAFLGIILLLFIFSFLFANGIGNMNVGSEFVVVFIFILLFLIAFVFLFAKMMAKAWKENGKVPHKGEPQLKANPQPSTDKTKEKEKQPPSSSKKKWVAIWLWRLIKLNFLILLIGAFFYYLPGITRIIGSINSGQISLSPRPTPIVIPSVCKDAWSREAKGFGNYSAEQNADHFDVQPTAGCFGEWIYPPSNWAGWEKEFMSGNDCRTWFWFFGETRPRGPYIASNLPSFERFPAKWRVSTNCPIRYFRTR